METIARRKTGVFLASNICSIIVAVVPLDFVAAMKPLAPDSRYFFPGQAAFNRRNELHRCTGCG